MPSEDQRLEAYRRTNERKHKLFANLARKAGLKWYPDPEGERYLFHVDGVGKDPRRCVKKGERPEFLEELWDALVQAHDGNKGQMFGDRRG